MFSYLVGNADFSLIASREGSCCHNAKLFQEDDDGNYLPVVYDFDSSGFVSAPYASPPAKLKLRSVRDRLYRGYCVEEDVFESVLSKFHDQRGALLDIANEPEALGKRTAKRAVSYLEDFYEVIDDPKKLKRENRGGMSVIAIAAAEIDYRGSRSRPWCWRALWVCSGFSPAQATRR